MLAEFEEGSPPDFNCMNEHYEMEFVKEVGAGKTVAKGTLTSNKVKFFIAKRGRGRRCFDVACIVWFVCLVVRLLGKRKTQYRSPMLEERGGCLHGRDPHCRDHLRTGVRQSWSFFGGVTGVLY